MLNVPDHVSVDLFMQQSALQRRVRSSGLYLHEVEEFPIALAAYDELWETLGIDEDLGSLTTGESRNVVRHVKLSDGTAAVLKVAGHVREPGEGEVLAAWRDAGLPCVEPLDWGYVSPLSGGVAIYLLTRFVDAPPFGRLGPEATVEQRCAVACQLTAFISRFHDCPIFLARSRTWRDQLKLHLRWTLPLVRTHGLEEPAAWEQKLATLSDQGHVVVHGDPAGGNVLVLADGGLLLLDPPGALRGMREADAGQICAQVGGSEHVYPVLASVCDAQPQLDPAAVSLFAGMNFLAWAGYFLVEHPDVHTETGTGSRSASHIHARDYLQIAAKLADQFPHNAAGG